MNQLLPRLAPHSRVWIFQSDRFFSDSEVEAIRKIMQDFVPQWASHGNDLYGDFTIEESLFLIVGVDESRSPVSGCSIDSLTRIVKETGVRLQADFFNRLAVSYLNAEGKIEIVDMNTFKQRISEGVITSDTIVYNNLVANQGELNEKWKTPVKNSWHMNLFELV